MRSLFLILALLAPTAACAQEVTPDNPLYGIPVPVHAGPTSVETVSYEGRCDTGAYGVMVRETQVEGEDLRRVDLETFTTPLGPLTADDYGEVVRALAPYWLIFGVNMECWPDGAAVVFTGRKRSEPGNSTLVVWIGEGRVTRIDG